MVGRRWFAMFACGVGLLVGACSGSEKPKPAAEGTILFVARVGEVSKHAELFAVDVRTGRRRNLTRTPDRDEYLPGVSPDRARIAFYATRPNELHVIDLRTRRRTRLASGADLAPDSSAVPPSWSPDGTRIAFGLTTGCEPVARCARSEIWIVRAAGGRATRLSRDGRTPTWSPDGRRLAWWDNVGLDGTGSRAMVWQADTGRRRIVGRAETPPAWRADGTLLAGDRVYDIGTGRSRRARPGDYGLRSADRSHVATVDDFFTGLLHVRAVDGGGLRLPDVAGHAWSPQGRRLAIRETSGVSRGLEPSCPS